MTQAIATGRKRRAAALRRDQTAPETQTGVSTGPVNRICPGQYTARLWPAAACRARKTSALGQPCAACQIRSGAASAAAMAPPISR